MKESEITKNKSQPYYFGKKLRKIIQNNDSGITIASVAQKADLSYNCIKALIDEKNAFPRTDSVSRILGAIGWTEEEFYSESEDVKKEIKRREDIDFIIDNVSLLNFEGADCISKMMRLLLECSSKK